jgi:TatD family-associated radical SAM protein
MEDIMQNIFYEYGESLYANLTNKCPNRCEFCVRENFEGVGSEGSLFLDREPDEAEALAELAKRDLKKYKELVFCGYGEPTCALDVMLAVAKKAKELGCKTRLNTNGLGSLVNGTCVPKLLEGLLDAVSISLNAPTADEYDAICHSEFGEGAFGAILDFASGCKKHVPEVRFTVVDVIGETKIEECKRAAEEAGVPLFVRRAM